MLCQVIRGLPEVGVNLYPEHLKPKKDTFTLKMVAVSWAVVSVLMLAGYGYCYFSLSQTEAKLAQAQKQDSALSAELKALQEKLRQHKPTPSKLLAAERFEEDIRSKETSLSSIRHYDESWQYGYSGIMEALAKLGRNDISVSSIEMNSTKLNLSGLARTPAAVPAWVRQFNQEVALAGRTFEKLDIGRNENGIITFKLSAKVEGERQ
jgi:MSHA biogenesis protein MshI